VKERRGKKLFFEIKIFFKNRVVPVFQARAGTITNFFCLCGLIENSITTSAAPHRGVSSAGSSFEELDIYYKNITIEH
jgi:hypothetical protein